MKCIWKKALAFAVAATTLLSAGASADSVDDGNAVFMMNEVMKENGTDRNLVFSPYSVQQILASIGANSHDQRLEKELAPYTVPGIRWETLKNTKTGGLILLDKNIGITDTTKASGDLRIVSFPDGALQEKIAFQNRILGDVIDRDAPQGNLAFLTAAHYFAEWQVPFDTANTKDRPFTLSDGTIEQVPTMYNEFETGLAKKTDDYEMTVLQGKKGSQVYFIKPTQNRDDVAAHLDRILDSFDRHEGVQEHVKLYIPKTKLESKMNIRPLFKTMGITSFFQGDLYFDTIAGDIPFTVTEAKQTTTLDINETYADAKALTEISFRVTSMPVVKTPVTVKMDSPYFIVIRDVTDTETPRIVFMAWIADPMRN